ncbi:Single-stranded dna binding protein [Mycena sanguinolenta]|uniref:Single-stranded dna binding protein n=1 Tax=Mycena sanguinolenta TaxID=230812 RepID=A0A8H6YAE1_9AGAR|nr:Single-stranded dna binding protein [Mycena sanguinolenta]
MSSSLLSGGLDFSGGSGEKAQVLNNRTDISFMGRNNKSVAFFGSRTPVPAVKAPSRDVAPAETAKLTDAVPAAGDEPFWNVDNDKVAQDFASCGEVVSTTIAVDRNTGQLRGFEHVHFTTTAVVEAALKMNGTEIDGRDERRLWTARGQEQGTREPRFGFSSERGGGVKSAAPDGSRHGAAEGLSGAKKAYAAANGQEIEGRAEGCKRRRRRTCELRRGRTGWGPWWTRARVEDAAVAGLVIAAGAMEVGDVARTVVDVVDAAHREEELGRAVFNYPLRFTVEDPMSGWNLNNFRASRNSVLSVSSSQGLDISPTTESSMVLS